MKTIIIDFHGRKLQIYMSKGNILLCESVALLEIASRNQNIDMALIAWGLYVLSESMNGGVIYAHDIISM